MRRCADDYMEVIWLATILLPELDTMPSTSGEVQQVLI